MTTGTLPLYDDLMSIARFKIVAMFLLAVLAAVIFWSFLLRGFAAHHADNAMVQGLAGVT